MKRAAGSPPRDGPAPAPKRAAAVRASLLVRKTISAAELMKKYPPHIKNVNKLVIFSKLGDGEHSGNITVSRWGPVPLDRTEVLPSALSITMKQDAYTYENPKNENEVDWYVNFADADLFVAYHASLFAQDEIQAAEHPACGAIKEWMKATKEGAFLPLTREGRRPTPILLAGLERRCSIELEPNEKEGRPNGLYGNAFARAPPEAVASAVSVLWPPTITNMICMAALGYRKGEYTPAQIEDAFQNALTSFAAAVSESHRMKPNSKVRIHTGNWGCGAFGGNPVLMAKVQLLAARYAGADEMIYHTFDKKGTAAFDEAKLKLEEELEPMPTLGMCLEYLARKGYRWGISDGN